MSLVRLFAVLLSVSALFGFDRRDTATVAPGPQLSIEIESTRSG
ncbi:hypothetical protein [Paractinoplanes deccanensis]|nr:hypothetical protein [Actinoplanes deccanensis]